MARPHATTYGHSLGARFLTRDPLEQVTRDPYGYGGGNPANNTDPLGLFCVGDFCTPSAEDVVEGLRETAEAVEGVIDGVGDVVRDGVSHLNEHVGIDANLCVVYCVGLTYIDGNLYLNSGFGAIASAGIGPSYYFEPPDPNSESCNPGTSASVGPFNASFTRDENDRTDFSELTSVGVAFGIPSLFLGHTNQRRIFTW